MGTVSRYHLVRYAGLAGATLLAVSAYLGGVKPTWHGGVTPLTIWQGEYGPLIVSTWLVGTGLLVGAWWYARRGVPSTRWAYVTVGLWLLPLVVAPPMGSRDVYSYACQGAVYTAGENPYSAGVAELGCPWLQSVSPMWWDSPAPYGPVFVLLAGAAAALGGTLVGTIVVLRVVAVLGVVLAAGCLPALARRCGVPGERALWLMLGCPIVAVHLVSGAHNDALMVGLMVAGLLVIVARPGRSWSLLVGGALLGLAIGVKVTAGVVVPFAALIAAPGPYRLRALLRHGGWVVGGAVLSVLATTTASGLGWGWVNGLTRSGDSIQWTSAPTAVGLAIEYVGRLFGVRFDAVPLVRVVALVVLALVLVALWWRARTGSPMTGAGIALAATVVLAPVFHPWYAVWPLAVLAVTVGSSQWFLLPFALATFLTLPDGTNLARFTKFPGVWVMTFLVVLVVARGCVGISAVIRQNIGTARSHPG